MTPAQWLTVRSGCETIALSAADVTSTTTIWQACQKKTSSMYIGTWCVLVMTFKQLCLLQYIG